MKVHSQPQQDNSPLITGISKVPGCPDVELGQAWKEKYGSGRVAVITAIDVNGDIEMEFQDALGGRCYVRHMLMTGEWESPQQ